MALFTATGMDHGVMTPCGVEPGVNVFFLTGELSLKHLSFNNFWYISMMKTLIHVKFKLIIFDVHDLTSAFFELCPT